MNFVIEKKKEKPTCQKEGNIKFNSLFFFFAVIFVCAKCECGCRYKSNFLGEFVTFF